MNIIRNKREDVRALRSIQNIYELANGQVFYETPKAFEIWNEEPLYRVERLPKKRIIFVWTH